MKRISNNYNSVFSYNSDFNYNNILNIFSTARRGVLPLPGSTTTQTSAVYALVKTTLFFIIALTLALPIGATWADTLDRDTLASHVEPPNELGERLSAGPP